MKLTLGHSPDPDDAFMFCALAQDQVDAEGLEFEHVLQDIQTLNERAERKELDITALSLHAYAFLADRYRLTSCGASVGDGYGPLIVSNRVFIEDELDADTVVHVPGEKTTAFLVLKLYAPDVKTEVLPFDEILPAIIEEKIETGLLIHEGQITFANYGMHKVEDLGEWWKLKTGLPLPLGVNAVRRDLPEDVQSKIQRVLNRSIDWGLEHRSEALEYAKQFGRGIDDWTNDRFVGMYVNKFTLDLGDAGREGVKQLLTQGAEAGMLPKEVVVDPIPHTEA
ncbi:MAG: MqnA/MqnD/SBP family protein [Planctomycetota bacterium JB042]